MVATIVSRNSTRYYVFLTGLKFVRIASSKFFQLDVMTFPFFPFMFPLAPSAANFQALSSHPLLRMEVPVSLAAQSQLAQSRFLKAFSTVSAL
jgi:hypothetical protein